MLCALTRLRMLGAVCEAKSRALALRWLIAGAHCTPPWHEHTHAGCWACQPARIAGCWHSILCAPRLPLLGMGCVWNALFRNALCCVPMVRWERILAGGGVSVKETAVVETQTRGSRRLVYIGLPFDALLLPLLRPAAFWRVLARWQLTLERFEARTG
jgi:hypothetical protein